MDRLMDDRRKEKEEERREVDEGIHGKKRKSTDEKLAEW